MLRKRIIYFAFLVGTTAAFLALKPQTAHSNGGLRRITNTPEVVLNLNPSLSDNGAVASFESTYDLAGTGYSTTVHSLRANLGSGGPIISEIAATRAAAPALSADGQIVAFASSEDLVGENADRNSEIYVDNHGALRQLTHTKPASSALRLVEGNFAPSISNDGRLIAFTSNRDLIGLNASGLSRVFLLDVVTKSVAQFSSDAKLSASSAKISGDGLHVAFVATGASGANSLNVIDVVSGATQLLEAAIVGLKLTEGRAISNDGTRVVYAAETAPHESQVFVFDVRENRSRQLTTLGSRVNDVELRPTISGDGKRIAFSTRRKVRGSSDGGVELYLLDLPTGEIQQITDAPASANAEVVSSLNYEGSVVVFNFPRIMSDQGVDPTFANNCEIYAASIASRPAFGVATAFNAASNGTEVSTVKTLAPGSIVTVKGSALAFDSREAMLSPNGTFSVSLSGTTASIQGHFAELVYVSPELVQIVLPSAIENGPAEIIIKNADEFSSKASIVVAPVSPGLFTYSGDGLGTGVVLSADTMLSSGFDPTSADLRLIAFGTGMRRASRLSGFIGGVPITVESVNSTNVPGLDEVHLLIPRSLRGAGKSELTLVADGVSSNSVSVVMEGDFLRDVMINEFLADPPDGLAGDANHDGARSASADEFIELVNATSRDLDLAAYELTTRNSAGDDVVRHRFPSGTIVSAGTAVVVFGGGTFEAADPAFFGAQVFKASSGSLSLPNSAGAISLRDPFGVIVSSLSYGTGSNIPAGTNESVTRNPDVFGRPVVHSSASASGALFSPGARIGGQPFLPLPAVNRVTLGPLLANMSIGDEVRFTANAFDVDGHELADILFKWRSSDPSIVDINAQGVAKAINPGTAKIVASARGISSLPLQIRVEPPAPTPTPTVVPSPTPSPSPSPSPDSSPTVSPSPTPPPILPPLVISEVRTRGPNGANDEFVELYNLSESSVRIGGLKLRASNNAGSISTRLTIAEGTILPAHCHFLAVNSAGYSGEVPGDQSYTNGITNDGGIALTLSNEVVIDQVGMSAGSRFREGVHLDPLPTDANQSYERRPGGVEGSGQDTNDNFADFRLLMPSDPQNLSSGPVPSLSPSPTPTPSPSPTPTSTPSPSPSPIPTPTPSASPTPTPIPSPSPSPSPSPTSSPSPTPSPSTGVVISQIYGGGGNSGAPFRNDFIELFNRGPATVNLSGWSVQYSSATGTTWAITALTPFQLEAGQYYLVQQASGGTNGVPLPTADVVGTIAMAATAGKVALVRSTTALSGACPTDVAIIDFVGYGTTASCFRGSAPAPAPGNATAAIRAAGGCTNNQNNTVDFSPNSPVPRNTGTAFNPCVILTALRSPVEYNLFQADRMMFRRLFMRFSRPP